MRLENMESFFEMAVAIEEESVQSQRDAYVTISISSDGFTGHNDLWVIGQAFTDFCRSLLSLERSLKGEARLESISPDELSLRIYPANNRGTLAVEGSTGYEVVTPDGSFWHSVSFGFTFEPQQLTNALSLPWVRR